MAKPMDINTVDQWKRHERMRMLQQAGLVLLAAGSLATVAWYGYRWYRNHRQEYGQRIFSHIYKEYVAAATQNDTPGLLQAASHFQDDFKKASDTTLAPYFLTFAADALYRAGEYDKAAQLLNQAVPLIPANSPYYYLYATKQALVALDQATDDAARAQAVQKLTALTDTKENIYADMALYYLIAYYKSTGDTAQVRTLQRRLQGFASGSSRDGASPWAMHTDSIA